MPQILSPSTSVFGELNFLGTGSVTNGNTQVLPLSTGLGFNVPTGKAFDFSIGGTSLIHAEAVTGPGAYIGLGGNLFSSGPYYYGDTGGLVLGAPASGTILGMIDTEVRLSISDSVAEFGTTDGISLTGTGGGVKFPAAFGQTSTSGNNELVAYGGGAGMLLRSQSHVTLYANDGATFAQANSDGYFVGDKGFRFNSTTATITSTNSEIGRTSSGIQLNVPSGKRFDFSVAGTAIAEIQSSYIYVPNNLLPYVDNNFFISGQSNTYYLRVSGGSGGEATGGAIYLYGNSHANAGDLAFCAGQTSGAAISLYDKNLAEQVRIDETGITLPSTGTGLTAAVGMWGNASGDYYLNAYTGRSVILSANGTGLLYVAPSAASLVSTNGLVLTSTTGSVSATDRQIFSSSNGLELNVPTSKDIRLSVNATNVMTLIGDLVTVNAQYGIQLASSTGTATGGYRMVYGSSGGLDYNTPSSTAHTFRVNGSSLFQMNAAGLAFTGSHSGLASGVLGLWGDGTGNLKLQATGTGINLLISGSTYAQLSTTAWALQGAVGLTFGATGTVTTGRGIWGNANGLEYGTVSSTSHAWNVNATQCMVLDTSFLELRVTNGLWLNTSSGSTSSSHRMIVGSTDGMLYNVPSAKSHIFTVNNVAVVTISSSGLVIQDDPQDYNIYASRKYR